MPKAKACRRCGGEFYHRTRVNCLACYPPQRKLGGYEAIRARLAGPITPGECIVCGDPVPGSGLYCRRACDQAAFWARHNGLSAAEHVELKRAGKAPRA